MRQNWHILSFVVLTLLIVNIGEVCARGPMEKNGQDNFFCEFGLSGGCGFVLGDVNETLFKNVQPVGGASFKYKFNGHWEIKVQGEGGLLGIADDDFTETDYRKNGTETFYGKKSVVFGGMQVLGEFNFFNFGVQKWAEYRKWFSPTLVAGLGFIGFNGNFAVTVPMGIGMKFKLSNRINMGLYWMVTKAFTDKLDYVDDPIGLNKGFWNNRDWYSTAQMYISVNFVKECAPCRNGVEVKRKY